MAACVYGNFYAFSSGRRPDRSKEINEAERRERKIARSKTSRDLESFLSLWLSARRFGKIRRPRRRNNIFQLASRTVFRINYLSLTICVVGAHKPGSEIQNLSEFKRTLVIVYGNLSAPQNSRADSPGKINETENSIRMRGRSRDQNALEIWNHFYLFGSLRDDSIESKDLGRKFKIL